MSFGNFLLGFGEGLGRGVETGEYVKGAIDRKARRDEGKRVFKEQEAKTATGQAPAPINGAPASGPPKPVGSGTPAPAPSAAPPAAPAPSASPSLMAGMSQGQASGPTYVPAQRIGAQAPTFNAQFPQGIAGQLGAMPGRFPTDQYPIPNY